MRDIMETLYIETCVSLCKSMDYRYNLGMGQQCAYPGFRGLSVKKVTKCFHLPVFARITRAMFCAAMRKVSPRCLCVLSWRVLQLSKGRAMTTYMQAPNGEVFTTDSPEYHKECTKLTQRAGKLARKEYARSELRKLITPGQTVYCTLRSVSSSGMSRVISLHIIDNGQLRGIDNLVADATDTKHAKRNGLIMSGCGMDMGFALVYNMGYALWPNGTDKPHCVRNGEPDSNGGYALKSEWI